MMSTPSRASWWAISSFSCLFNEIPGDCSPSRRVVSKIRTRSASLRPPPPALLPADVLMSLVLLLYLACSSSLLGMRLRGRHALFPPRGEQEKREKRGLQRHSIRRLASGAADDKRIVARATRAAAPRDPSAGYGVRTTLPMFLRSVIMLCAAPASSKL